MNSTPELQRNSRLKGLYLLSEIECLSVGSGAYYHIQHGIQELGKYYDIVFFLITQKKKADDNSLPAKAVVNKKRSKSLWKGTAKWFYLLVSRNVDFIKWYRRIKSERPDFLYERASFLNFKGLLISRMLSIPHFYEVNGAFYLEANAYFPLWLGKVSKKLETWAYKRSTHSFLVGTISQSYRLEKRNYTDVQNGIESSFAARFTNKSAVIAPDQVVNVVFIGHAMKHHGLDVLASACELLSSPTHFSFHFVGTNYENLNLKFPASVKPVFHGKLNHEEIAQLLLKCEIGVLPLTVPFSSAVKLFMYGAAKLLLIIPDVPNLKRIFDDEEVLFFENGNAASLANAFNSVDKQRSLFQDRGGKVYEKVRKRFFWSEIFREEVDIMNSYLPA